MTGDTAVCRTLGRTLAGECHAYAKTLHYHELRFCSDPGLAMEALTITMKCSILKMSLHAGRWARWPRSAMHCQGTALLRAGLSQRPGIDWGSADQHQREVQHTEDVFACRTLGALAEKCHAYAKALHYRELEFRSDPEAAVEALISINNNLRLPEAADGILAHAQGTLHMDLKVHTSPALRAHNSGKTLLLSSSRMWMPRCMLSQQLHQLGIRLQRAAILHMPRACCI